MTQFHAVPDDLITGFLRQSYAGAVRQRLLEIERAVQAGHRHEAIVLGLHKQGVRASMGTFRKSLSRARIWWRRQLLIQQAQRNAPVADLQQGTAVSLERGGHEENVIASSSQTSKTVGQLSAASLTAQSATPSSQDGVSGKSAVIRPQTRPVSAAGVGRVDLDQFFKPKSVFSKS